MGLIKTVFGGFFAFIGGLLGGVAKLFGFGQKSGFYMELDESTTPLPSTSIAAAPQQAIALDNGSVPTKPVTPKKSQASPVAKAPVESQPVEPQKEVSQAADSNASTDPVQPQISSSAFIPKRPLVSPRPQAETEVQESQQLTNFATDFLVNPKLKRPSRRLPGPSVSPFKEMAKKMGKGSPSIG